VHLDVDTAPKDAKGIVLVLHGGRENGEQPTSPRQLAVLRARPFARRLQRLAGNELVVARIRYSVRGWNGHQESPLADARLAISRLAERFEDASIALVGYSMGGRTAVRVGDDPRVTTIVGLAPWLPKGEPIPDLAGRNVLFIHGNHDHVTSYKGSAFVTAQLHAEGVNASFVEVDGETHPMLRQPGLWHDLTAGYVIHHLLGRTVPGSVPELLQRVLDGDAHITV